MRLFKSLRHPEKEEAETPPAFSFAFLKRDAQTGLPQPDVLFRLVGESGEPALQAVSDPWGRVRFDALLPGTYFLTEDAPAGAPAERPPYTVRVDGCGDVRVDGIPAARFQPGISAASCGDLVLFQRDARTGAPLRGAVLELRQGETAVCAVSSDEEGRLTFRGLFPGRFTLTESRPPRGYLPQAASYVLDIPAAGPPLLDGKPAQGSALYSQPFATLYLRLTDGSANPLAGAAYAVEQNGGHFAFITTDDTGTAQVTLSAPGTYTVREALPPPGCEPNAAVHTAVLQPDGILTVDGEEKTAIDAVSEPRLFFVAFRAAGAGAAFRLHAEESRTAVSDADGYVVFAAVPAGSYTLVQTAASPGYQPDPGCHAVLVEADGAAFVDGLPLPAFAVRNAPAPGFSLAVHSGAGLPLADAAFELLQQDRVVLCRTTDEEGGALFAPLEPGEYTLQETQAPADYRPDEAVYAVTVAEDGGVLVNGTALSGPLPLTNAPAPGVLFFTVTDGGDGQPVEGAVFALQPEGAPAFSAVSDAQGRVRFPAVPAGIYTLRETAVPDDYALPDTAWHVTTDEEGCLLLEGSPCGGPPLCLYRLVSLYGRCIWEDNGNARGRRPASVFIELLRDGAAVDRIELPGTQTAFRFDQVALYRPDGTPYTYTVQQMPPPDGYIQHTADLVITNTWAQYSVTVLCEDEAGGELARSVYAVPAAQAFTAYLPVLTGYEPLCASPVALASVDRDQIVRFSYRPLDT